MSDVKTKPTKPETAEEFIPADFVYQGKRWLDDNTLGQAIALVMEDGTLGPQRLYGLKGYRGLLGGIYTGATFSGSQSKGIKDARFTKRWANADDLIDWDARDKAAEVEAAAYKLQKDLKRKSEIDQIMLPLRRRIQLYRERHDFASEMAMKQAVQASLVKPLYANERN